MFVGDALAVGIIVPGETAAVLGDVAASLGHMPLTVVVAAVIAVIVIGDTVGHEVGRHLALGCCP
jgi:membrane protein DedA with SNARE-associated domain